MRSVVCAMIAVMVPGGNAAAESALAWLYDESTSRAISRLSVPADLVPAQRPGKSVRAELASGTLRLYPEEPEVWVAALSGSAAVREICRGVSSYICAGKSVVMSSAWEGDSSLLLVDARGHVRQLRAPDNGLCLLIGYAPRQCLVYWLEAPDGGEPTYDALKAKGVLRSSRIETGERAAEKIGSTSR